nr:hypothetical protein [Tanacetum cinerariifolium]
DKNPIRTLGDYSKPSHDGYRNTIELPAGTTWYLFEPTPSDWCKTDAHSIDFDLWLQVQILYDHVNPVTRRTIDESDDGKLRDLNVKESWALLEDLTLYDIESLNVLKDFVKPVKAISLPQDVRVHLTACCMEDPEQAFVDYASSRINEVGGKWYNFKPDQNNLGDTYNSSWKSHQNLRLSKFEADFKQQQGKMTNKIDTVLKDITDRIAGTLPSDTIKNPKLGTHLVLSARSYPTMDPQWSTQIHSSINAIMIHPKQQTDSHDDQTKENEEEERDSPKSHSDSFTPLNPSILVSNFTERIEGMHVFVGDFTYVVDFMIVEGISSIIDLMLSHVVLGKPFIEVSNMTHDLPEGIVRNKEDKGRGVEYVMSKILGFYKDSLELGPEYLRGMDDKGEVT